MKRVLFLIVLLHSLLNADYNTTLTKDDIRLIDKYIQNVSIEDSIGQLFMVGINDNYKGYLNSKKIPLLIKKLGVGFVIVNKQNYKAKKKDFPNNEAHLDAVISFNDYLQKTAMSSPLGIPLLLAADFESSKMTFLKQGIILPPPALTLGATHDAKIIENNAILSGLQLKNLGIDILLGPVLDRYDISVGKKEKTLLNRSFSSNADNLIKASSHYIKGLNKSGILIFTKHFPSHGKVHINPHFSKKPALYLGSTEEFKADLKAFKVFKNSIDGLMLSHIQIPQQPFNINTPASLSSKFITNHVKATGNLSLNYQNKIIITDDLSTMGAIKLYKEKTNKSYPHILLKAYKAGNDILMLSYLHGDSNINVTDLIKAKRKILKYISSSPENIQRFKSSLKKIILLKSKIAKQKQIPIQTLLEKKFNVFKNKTSGYEVLNKSEAFLKETPYKNHRNLIKKTIASGSILINNVITPKISDLKNKDINVLFVIEKSQIAKFKNNFNTDEINSSFQETYSNQDFKIYQKKFKRCQKKYKKNFRECKKRYNKKCYKEFEEYKKEFKKKIDKYAYIIYTIQKKDDITTIQYIELYKPKALKKIILFVHENPSGLPMKILQETTVISSFTAHDLSYDNDIDILNGEVIPKEIKFIPIDLGQHSKVQKSNLKIATDGNFDYSLVYTDTEKKLKAISNELVIYKNENEKYKKTIEELNTTLKEYDFYEKRLNK